jgi:lysozyme
MNIKAIQQLIVKHEGIRSATYRDTAGKRTIGVGFNLDAPGAEQAFQAVLPAVSFTQVLLGLVKLTAEQIQDLFDYSTAIAIEDAKRLFPSFDVQPDQAQQVLVDMSFNLGYSKYRHFVKFIAAISREDYKGAIAQLQNTAWRIEVGARATDDIALLSEVANYRTFLPEVPPSTAKPSTA